MLCPDAANPVQRLTIRLSGQAWSDQEIAAQLNRSGATTGATRRWNIWAVRWARGRAKISRLTEDCPVDQPVPDRHADGRYSIAGTAKRYGVSSDVVYRWVKRGLVPAERERYGAHPSVLWLRIDRATAARLARASKRSLQRGGR